MKYENFDSDQTFYKAIDEIREKQLYQAKQK